MDYVEGESLKEIIFDAESSVSEEQIREILRSVTGALHYAHSMGLVHCDIKPANIMLNKHGEVRLADFGIARMTDASTATMVGAGTPAYMAPEQIRGQDPTPQSDIYALGIILYEMFTGGERPFTGEQATITGTTSEKVRWEQLNLSPPSPRQWTPDLSTEKEAVTLRCLEKNPSKRYQNVLDFFNAFELTTGDKEADAIFSEASVKISPFPSEEKVEKKEEPKKTIQKALQEEKVRKISWLPTIGIIFTAIILLSTGGLMKNNLMKLVSTETPTITFTPTNTSTPTLTFTPIFTATPSATFTPIATPMPTLGIGSTWKRPTDRMTMHYIPAGEFEMGSEAFESDERPIHTI